MAKINSLFSIKGNLGGANFYIRNGQIYARNPSTLDATRIKTDPRFRRVRESNQEFAGAANAGKALRTALNSLVRQFIGGNVPNRLFVIFRSMLKQGSGQRGMRTIDVSANKSMLAGFEFSLINLVTQVFPVNCQMAANADRNEVTLTIPAFDPKSSLTYSEFPSHFTMTLMIGALPNFEFNQTTKKYEPVHPELVGVYGKSSTDMLALKDAIAKPIVLKASLEGSPKLPDTAVLVACMAIQYHQEVNGTMYLLQQDTCMKIHGVF